MIGMAWELDADRPIYAQLVERIQKEIVSGKYQPGEKLPHTFFIDISGAL